MRWARWLGVGGAAVVWIGACSYPEFEYDDDGPDTSTTQGSGGGAVTTSTTGTGGSASGGNGATGGAGDGGDIVEGCPLGEAGVCGAGKKCSVVDEDTGATDCVTAGTRPPWAKCISDADCAELAYCDPINFVCKPLCESLADCQSELAQCTPALVSLSPDVAIPNLKLCTAHCNPKDAAPCHQSGGPTTCFYDVDLAEFDCTTTVNIPVGETCSTYNACVKGAACVGNVCRSWCTPPGGIFACIFNSCDGLNPTVVYDEDTYGVCSL